MYLTWLEINQTALLHNIQTLSPIAAPTQLMFVLKGNAYGHGFLEIATIIHKHFPTNYICVAFASEALALRKAGITNPVLVLVHYEKNYEVTFEYDNITLTIGEKADLVYLEQHVQRSQKPLIIHLKVDTGMSRLGFTPQEAREIIKAYLYHPFITIEGMYTHIFNKETKDSPTTHHQLTLFKNIVTPIISLTNRPLLIHALSSGAFQHIQHYPYTHVRIGTHLYGLNTACKKDQEPTNSSPDALLQPVMTWKSRIISIKTIPPGTCVGYGCTFKAPKTMKIATLPVGYSDGYPRQLSHQAMVYLHNTTVPVIGIISMNLITIDISSLSNVALYDEVIILGNYPGITAEDLAQKLNTIPLEITTRINPRIPRNII